jgi:hypothetical protein
MTPEQLLILETKAFGLAAAKGGKVVRSGGARSQGGILSSGFVGVARRALQAPGEVGPPSRFTTYVPEKAWFSHF